MTKKKYVVDAKFGKLTIIKIIKSPGHRTRYLCNCECGKEIEYSSKNISYKLDCGCSSMNRRGGDLTGQKKEKLTIIKWLKTEQGRNIWECKCDCGEIFEISTSYFKNRFIDCYKCRQARIPNQEGYKDIPRFLLTRTKTGAKDRGLEFNVTEKFLWQLFVKQNKKCALSGQDIIFTQKSLSTTASLDRIDSSKGYIEGNVQWVHKVVNRIKQHYHQDIFLKFCLDIAKNFDKHKFDKESSWHQHYFHLIETISTKSKDPSTKVGCLIVGEDHEIRSTGYNSLPREVNDNISERYQYPLKSYFCEHAERNAIYNAARVGIPTKGCTAYIPFLPCPDCARAIIQAGIIRVVYSIEQNERWKSPKYTPELLGYSVEMLEEAKIELVGI